MFDNIMKHKGSLGLVFFGIGTFASELLHLINSTIFFGWMGGLLLIGLGIRFLLR